MEVRARRNKEEFSPIELTIEIKSKEELEVIYALFNYIPLCEVMRDNAINPSYIREALNEVAGTIKYIHIINKFDESLRIS